MSESGLLDQVLELAGRGTAVLGGAAERQWYRARMAFLCDIYSADGAIEIGAIWFSPVLQRTRAATEAIFLLMQYAMDELRYQRLVWRCNAVNRASLNAAARYGFTRRHLAPFGPQAKGVAATWRGTRSSPPNGRLAATRSAPGSPTRISTSTDAPDRLAHPPANS